MINTRLCEVDDAVGAGLAAEPAEHLAVNDPEPGAGEHRDRQFGDHRHVQGRAVARLQPAEIFEQRGEFVHPNIELLIGNVLDRLVFQFRDEMDGGLVLVLRQVAVDAVVTGVDPAADIPPPERGVAGIERFVPGLVPIEESGVLVEAFGEFIEREPLIDVLVGQIGLGDKLWRRVIFFLFLPMDRNLSFGDVVLFCDLFCHFLAPEFIGDGAARPDISNDAGPSVRPTGGVLKRRPGLQQRSLRGDPRHPADD